VSGAPTVEPEGGGWVVRVERRHDGAVGSEQQARDPAYAELAAARAWAALGRRLLAEGDAEGAIACARAGLDGIGPPPFDPNLIDDTKMKLFAADDRIEQGHAADGAEVMLDVLDIRSDLHARARDATLLPTQAT
jgi:hypothetical protein